MPLNPNRRGRGIEKRQPVIYADQSIADDEAAILTGVADHVYVVHRLTIQYPTDISAIDVDLKIDGIYQDGTPYDFFTVADDGAVTELSTVVNTWVNPSPPANTVICYVEFMNGIPLAEGDTITLIGNDGSDAANYTSGGAVALKVVLDYEDLDARAYYQNRD